MMATIGDRRTFFRDLAWRLPDLLLVIAGPFQESLRVEMANRSLNRTAAFELTKHLSKPSLFKQSRAGYRPPAGTRILDRLNGLPEQSVSHRPLRNKGRCHDR